MIIIPNTPDSLIDIALKAIIANRSNTEIMYGRSTDIREDIKVGLDAVLLSRGDANTREHEADSQKIGIVKGKEQVKPIPVTDTLNLVMENQDIIERVARALHNTDFHPSDHGSKQVEEFWLKDRIKFIKKAKAAIAAMMGDGSFKNPYTCITYALQQLGKPSEMLDNMPMPAPEDYQRTDIEKEFEAEFGNVLDYTRRADCWGRAVYLHPHVESIYSGFKHAWLRATVREAGEEMVPKWSLDSQIQISNELRSQLEQCQRLLAAKSDRELMNTPMTDFSNYCASLKPIPKEVVDSLTKAFRCDECGCSINYHAPNCSKINSIEGQK